MRKWLWVGVFLLSGQAMALQPGDALQSWTLLDQFDQPYTLDQDARVLLVARDMTAAKLVESAFGAQPKGYLESRGARFLADISRMPSVIASLFAVPAMRDYGYRVMLDRAPRVVPRYPVREGSVLWVGLEQGRVTELRYFSSASELAAAVEAQ